VPQDAESTEPTPDHLDHHTLRELAHKARLLMEISDRRERHFLERMRVRHGITHNTDEPTPSATPVRRPRKAAQNPPEREPAHEVVVTDGHELTSPISESELRARLDARYAQEDALLINFREQAARPSAAPDPGPDLSR
jgi:hypothetical protein